LLLSLNNRHSQGSFEDKLQGLLDALFEDFEDLNLLDAIGLTQLRRKKGEKKYDLALCPECGKWFNPLDPEMFAPEEPITPDKTHDSDRPI
jgi:hypothetical protein